MTEDPTFGHAYDPGDVGRRLIERRNELGLSREEVAREAGMDPGYLRHVEQEANARPSPAACARLAVVLKTSVTWLRGGGLDRPPGGGSPSPAGNPVLEVMDRAECLRKLAPGGVGRVVFDDSRGPVALPVNFRLLGESVYFRTSDGSIAAALERASTMSVEVDHLDDALGEGWSVLVTGASHIVTDSVELAEVDAAHVEPWAGGHRHRVGRVSVGTVTGRRIRRTLP
jgi:nitroimidazol reductase NimA-like FMN-containing flavoprotein (pyridoxamine 5'-phosphate oxidase superfamily)/DNA-binding XRE family transcriptional regulator